MLPRLRLREQTYGPALSSTSARSVLATMRVTNQGGHMGTNNYGLGPEPEPHKEKPELHISVREVELYKALDELATAVALLPFKEIAAVDELYKAEMRALGFISQAVKEGRYDAEL